MSAAVRADEHGGERQHDEGDERDRRRRRAEAEARAPRASGVATPSQSTGAPVSSRRCREHVARRRAAPQPNARARAQKTSSVTPNAQTTVAPVGRSSAADATTPSTLTSVPNAQPIEELRAHGAAERDPGERGDDQVREHEQHAADPHRARHDDAERGVEHEVPERARASPARTRRRDRWRSGRTGGGRASAAAPTAA